MVKIKTLFMVPTTRCNLRCSMCDFGVKPPETLPLDVIKRVLSEGAGMGAKDVDYTGGEPLLHPDSEEIFRFAAGLGYSQTLTTNGLLINEENASRIARLVGDIRISVEGSREIHDGIRGRGNFERAVNSVALLTEEDAGVSLQMVISRKSYSHIKDLIDLADELGVGRVIYQPFQPTLLSERKDTRREFMIEGDEDIAALGRGVRETMDYSKKRGVEIRYPILLELSPAFFARGGLLYPEKTCRIPFNSLVVRADGTVNPCYNLWNVKAGNVFDEGLEEIFGSMRFELGRKLAVKRRCNGCLWACSDIENYRLPEERVSGVGRVKRELIRNFNLAYQLYCSRGPGGVFSGLMERHSG